MFEGKTLRGATGTPQDRMERAKSSLADADPDPFTLANLMTKSLVASIRFIRVDLYSAWIVGSCGFALRMAAASRAGLGRLQQELLHVPCAGRTALGAEAAVQAHVLVLGHDAAGFQGL